MLFSSLNVSFSELGKTELVVLIGLLVGILITCIFVRGALVFYSARGPGFDPLGRRG